MDTGFWLVVGLSVIEVYGDFSLRFYAQTSKLHWLVHGLIGYAGVVWMLIQSFKYNNVLYVNGLWDGLSGVIGSVAAYVFLGDRLEKTSQYLGLVLSISGILLLKNKMEIGF